MITVKFPCPTCGEVETKPDTVYSENLHPAKATCPKCGVQYGFNQGDGYLSGVTFTGDEVEGEMPTTVVTITSTKGTL